MRLLVTTLFVAALCAASPDICSAQAVTAEPPITNLKAALDLVVWNVAERGPILAIAPDIVLHNFPSRNDPDYVDPPEVLYFPEPGRGLRLEAVAHYFDRRVVRLGSLAAVIPTETVALNPHLRKADPFASLQYSEKLILLQGGLSAAQWAILGSPNGIGVGDLSEDQQTLFLSILPDPVAVEKRRNADNEIEISQRVTGQERAQLRLRINWTSTVSLIDGAGKKFGFGVSDTGLQPETTTLETYDRNAPLADSLYGAQIRLHVPNRPKTGQLDFGLPILDATISTETAKTVGDLVRLVREASRLDVYIDGRLATYPVFISDLHARVRCGDVLKALCLALSGTIRKVGPDDSGDIAYILTDSIEGLGARRVLIGAWAERARSQLNLALGKSGAAREAQRPGQYLSFQSDDPLALSPEIMRQIEADWSRPDKRGLAGEITIPVSELSPLQRNAVATEIERYKQYLAANPSSGRGGVTSSDVQINLMVTHDWLIPGIGTARSGGAEMSDMWISPPQRRKPRSDSRAAPDPAPVVLHGATVAIAPQEPGDAAAVMDVLKQKGVRKMWIEASDDAKGIGLLKEAIAAGLAHGISVSPRIRLMEAEGAALQIDDKGKETSSAALDLDIFGVSGGAAPLHSPTDAGEIGDDPERYINALVTGDIVDPGSANTLAILERRLDEFAAVKGITGIALCETSVLGRSASAESVHTSPLFADLGTDFGYTLQNRLRFLREQGYDPIDLLPAHVGLARAESVQKTTALQYFDVALSGQQILETGQSFLERRRLGEAWDALCQAEQTRLLESLRATFHKAHPEIPVSVPEKRSSDWAFAWNYGPWSAQLRLPLAPANPVSGSRPLAPSDARALAETPCFVCTPALVSFANLGSFSFAPQKTAGASLSWLFRRTPRSDGPKSAPDDAILDFTAMPIADTIALLRDGLADQTP